MIDPTAKQTTFKKFYHYQSFNREYLISMLQEQKLFFSAPHSVNDPWDCKPWFDYRPMLKDLTKRREMIEFLRRLVPLETLHHPLRPVYEERLLRDDASLIQAVEACSRNLGNELAKRRIYCLTPFSDSTLMWSHYATRHRGICLEFDKNNDLIGRARPVKYGSTYPEWTPHEMENPLELVLTKSMDWSYEREFRIIASTLDGPLKLYGDFVLLPPDALTSIIGGCESHDYDEITAIVKDHAPSITVKRVMRVPNHYKLAIVD